MSSVAVAGAGAPACHRRTGPTWAPGAATVGSARGAPDDIATVPFATGLLLVTAEAPIVTDDDLPKGRYVVDPATGVFHRLRVSGADAEAVLGAPVGVSAATREFFIAEWHDAAPHLFAIDASGRAHDVALPERTSPRAVAADGKTVLAESRDGNDLTQFTRGAPNAKTLILARTPAESWFAPDGGRFAYVPANSGNVMVVDLGQPPRSVAELGPVRRVHFSKDGQRLLVVAARPNAKPGTSANSLWIVDLRTSDGPREVPLPSPAPIGSDDETRRNEHDGRLSVGDATWTSDGTQIAALVDHESHCRWCVDSIGDQFNCCDGELVLVREDGSVVAHVSGRRFAMGYIDSL